MGPTRVAFFGTRGKNKTPYKTSTQEGKPRTRTDEKKSKKQNKGFTTLRVAVLGGADQKFRLKLGEEGTPNKKDITWCIRF